ncbi:Zinc finger MYM-type protein 1 [Glycine max]|nr:Zinc finger MYM-type protein 1 [Glycine max]
MNQNQHIEVVISKQSEQVRDLYRRHLTMSIDCIRFLLKQGLAFRGHDKSTNSANQGNFLELHRFLAEHNESINHVVLENAPENHQLIASKIQKDIVNAAALETTNAIITDLGDELVAIIVDEAHDISNKEQMDIALRYANKKGSIVERFFGMVHVKDTTALSLKMAIDELFCKHGLSISRIHGQGYDGASNMQGEFSGLKKDGSNADQRAKANGLLHLLEDFDFAFTLHLMKNVLGISNELSQALQRKDQDIINAMNLVNITKLRLQIMRDNGWEFLLQEVNSFCDKHFINIPNMEDIFFSKGRSQRGAKAQAITTEHHYHVELFYTVVDMQLQELNDLMLDNQLETYIIDMRSNVEFSSLKGIKNLSEKLVEIGRHIVYPLVYLHLKLAMILPVATSTVERAFSAMKIVKNRLRNRLGDTWMNDCLVTYIEKDVFNKIDNELIIQRFQNMKSRRGQL